MAAVEDGEGGPEPSILRRVGLAALIHGLFRFFVPRQDASRSRNPLPEVTTSGHVSVRQKTCTKDVFVFRARERHEHQYQRVILDSASAYNLVNWRTVQDLGYTRHDVRPYRGDKVWALDSGVWPVGTISLKFKFPGENAQVYEEEFHILPTTRFRSSNVGTRFDLLLCWGWMDAHEHEWRPRNRTEGKQTMTVEDG